MKYSIALGVLFVAILFIGCGKTETDACQPLGNKEIQTILEKVQSMPLEAIAENEVAVLETNYGDIAIEFFQDVAPQHAQAFKRLIKAGYYDCSKFHRIIKNFVIQGGDILSRDSDPENDGQGGPGYTLPAEFSDIPHDKGIVSMARVGGDNNSAGSQFFICLSRDGTRPLDRQYTVFGKVVKGIDVVEKIEDEPVVASSSGEMSKPSEPVFVKRAYMAAK